MALRKSLVPIFSGGGIDTKSDPRLMPQGSLVEVENMYYQRTGELRLRNGYTALTAGAFPFRYVFMDHTGHIAGLYSGSSATAGFAEFSPTTNQWQSITSGTIRPHPALTVGVSSVSAGSTTAAGTGDQTDQDSCVTTVSGKKYITSVWLETGAGVAYFAVHASDGASISTRSPLATTAWPVRCVASTRYSCLLVCNPSSSLVTRVIDNGNANPLTAVTYTLHLNGLLPAAPWISAISASSGSNVIVAYRAAAGGTSLLEFNPATGAVVTGPVNIAAADSSMALALLDDKQSSGSYWLATAGSGSGVVVRQLTTAFGVTATRVISAGATTNVRNITGYLDTTTDFTVFWDVNATPSANAKVVTGIWASGAATVLDAMLSVSLASKAFVGLGGVYNFAVSYDSPTQPGNFIVRCLSSDLYATVVGSFLQGSGGGKTNLSNSLASFNLDETGTLMIGAMPKKTRLTTVSGSVLSLRSTVRASITLSSASARPKIVGRNTFIPGGIICVFDGTVGLMAAPLLAPEPPTVAASASAGSMTVGGVYQYVTVFRTIMSDGRYCRSPPSTPTTVTVGGTGATDVSASSLRVGSIPSGATQGVSFMAEIYRQGPAASGASGYNKVSEVRNDPSVNVCATIIDTLSDATAAAGETLYTTGGVLENFPGPAGSLLEICGNRLWTANPEEAAELWYSKDYKASTGVAFHSLQALRIEGDSSGPITALAAMDGRLIVFKSSAIYVISGDGPNDLGQGSFNAPQAASLSIGTARPGSVVATPQGIMFQSAKGIYLLDRGLGLTYVGKAVEQYTLAANIVDASLVQNFTQVRFVFANGRCLVWDYDQQKWVTFLLPVAGSTVVACVDAPGGWCYALANGTVHQETAGSYTDPGSLAIVPRVGFPYLALAAINGYQRCSGVEILGEYVGNHTLSAQFEYDYSGSATETRTRAITAGAYQYEVKIAQQKMSALKITLTTSVLAAGSGAFRLTGISLILGVKRGSGVLYSKRLT